MKISILGDVCPTDDTEQFFISGETGKYSSKLVSHLNNSDVVVANLEYSLTDFPKKFNKTGPVLHYPSKTLSFIKGLGISHLSLANNHIKDCGPDAVIETINHCQESGLTTFGAGKDVRDAKRATFIDKDDIRVCLVSFAEHEFNVAYDDEAGAALFDPYEDLDYLKALSEQSDYLIVVYHGGIEYHKYPSPLLQKRCRNMADRGADLILCQHSHVIGSEETYNDCKIVYGQGNSVYGYRDGNHDWNTGLLIDLEIESSANIEPSFTYSILEAKSNSLDLREVLTEGENEYSDYVNRSKLILTPGFIQAEWDKFCLSKKALYLPQLFGLSRYLNILNRLAGNLLIDFFYSKSSKIVTQNLIRCESHNEVVQTILEKSTK